MNNLNNIVAALGLDKCKTDKERAAILQEEIARREADLEPIKEMYQTVFERIVSEWYNEFTVKYPELESQTSNLDDRIQTAVEVDGVHYYTCIDNFRNELCCYTIVLEKEKKRSKRIIDKKVLESRNFKSRSVDEEIIFEEFAANDFDGAFSCFCKIVEMLLELTNTQQ